VCERGKEENFKNVESKEFKVKRRSEKRSQGENQFRSREERKREERKGEERKKKKGQRIILSSRKRQRRTKNRNSCGLPQTLYSGMKSSGTKSGTKSGREKERNGNAPAENGGGSLFVSLLNVDPLIDR